MNGETETISQIVEFIDFSIRHEMVISTGF